MTPNTAITRHNAEMEAPRTGLLDIARHLPEMREMAQVFVKAAIVNKQLDTQEKVLAIMFKAHELGVSQTYALEKMSVINGNITMESELMLALIYKSGVCAAVDIKEAKDTCSVTMQRIVPKIKHTSTFTMQDANRAGLTSKENWTKYPKVMCRWRAISECAKVVFPDVLGGMVENMPLSVRIAPPDSDPPPDQYEASATNSETADTASNDAASVEPNTASTSDVKNENPSTEILKRPYQPDHLKYSLREFAAKNKNGNEEVLRKELEGLWGLCINGTEEESRSFFRMVFGKSEICYLSVGECNAVLRWLNPQSEVNGDVKTSPHLVPEFRAIVSPHLAQP